jgi:hypothetical protein
LLHEVDAQHRQQRKGESPGTTFGVVRGNELDQRSPWHHLFHRRQEHLFTGFLNAEIEVQGDLLNGQYFLRQGLPHHVIHKSPTELCYAFNSKSRK